jgi:hypothetical protein
MNPKKTKKAETTFEEPIIPEGIEVTVAQVAEFMKDEPETVRRGLTAYAPFDFGGRHYEAGDTFTVPAGYKTDADFDVFRAMEKKNAVPGQLFGIAFTGKDGRRTILPVKEV